MDEGSQSQYDMFSPEDFVWCVRKIPNWLGGSEYMIEILGADGCVSLGETVAVAKKGLKEALQIWIRNHGEFSLPAECQGAQIILLEPPMNEEEMQYINFELQKMK